MKSRRRILILAGAVAGLASGFTVRSLQMRGSAGDSQNGNGARSSLTAAGGAHADSSDSVIGRKPPSSLAVALEQQLNVSSGVMRWLEWMAALEHAKLPDFPHMVRMTKGNSVALRMIAAQWIELDPNHLFETLLATASESGDSQGFPHYELGRLLFEEWINRDAAGAVAALTRTGFPGNLRDLRYSAINSLVKKDPETALKTLSAWHIDNYGIDPASIAKWAGPNPRHAAEFALANPAGYATESTMGEIGKVWAKTNPGEAMTFAAGMKDKNGVALATGIIKEWAAKDLAKAAAWLAAAEPSVRGRLSGPMVEHWAKTDTSGAMEWIQQNLSGSSMDEAIGSVLKGAADKDVASAAAIVSGMEATPGRAKAAVSVAKNWFPKFDSMKTPAPEAVAWLSSLDPGSIKHVMEQLQWQWAGSDPKSLCDFLLTPAGQHSPPYAFLGTAREMARNNPVEALEWANKLPAENRDGAVSNVFSEWQNSQPASAMEWLRKLPVTDPRRESYFIAAVGDFMPGSAETEQVGKLLAAGNNAAAREAVDKLSMPDDRKQRLLNRLQLK